MASNITVSSDKMLDGVMSVINAFKTSAVVAMKEATKETAKEISADVKDEARKVSVRGGVMSEPHTGLKKTGEYIKSWSYKKTAEGTYNIEYNVRSRDRYRLTHLLEYGHAIVSHGKVTGKRVPAYPHISKASEKAQNVMLKYLDVELKRYDES